MTIEDEVLWLEERLQAMNPSVNLNDGSPANTQVIQPFRRRFEPDPLESSILPFIIGRIRQEFPNITAEEGDAFIDLVVKPMAILLEPFRREIRAVKRNQSIADPSVLNKDEADAILANTFFRRSSGEYSRGKIRIYFANAVTLSVGSSNVGFTSSGLRYLVSQPQSITSQSMLLNTEGALYYWDIDFVAEATGKIYDIDKGKIIGVTGISSATKATNPFKFSGGDTEETTTELVARSEESIGERSLNTVPGAVANLFEEFDQLQILQIIGFNDVEMQRDVITGGSLGTTVLYGDNAASFVDDGDGFTSFLNDTASGNDFTTTFGPVGTDLSEYVVTAWISGSWTGQKPTDFQLGEVIGATRVSINDQYTHAERVQTPQSGVSYTIRKREVLLSDIPGGILFPDSNGNELSVAPNQVHIGGCSDYYVNGGEQSEQTMALSIVADRDPVVKGLVIQTYDGTTAPADRIDVTMTEDEYDAVVENQTMVRILRATSNLGAYRIVRKLQYNSTFGEFVIDSDLVGPEESSVYGDLIDDIDVELTAPYEVVVEGTDLRTYAGLLLVDTEGGTNFTDYGIALGATTLKLVIVNGEDEGTYEISNVASTVLTLGDSMTDTASPLQYRVIRELSDEIDLPLRRISKLELLDANSDPTGDELPYRHPIDVISRRFANVGRGAKAGTSSSLSSNDLIAAVTGFDYVTSTESINYWDLGVRLNDILNVNTGDNQGYYIVTGVGGGPSPIGTGLTDKQLRVDRAFTWIDSNMEYEVGAPSVGSFRLYFLDPCSVSVSYDETLMSVSVNETDRRFRPDPDVSTELLPSETTVPTGSMAAASPTIVNTYAPDGATEVRLWNYGAKVGDYAEITYAPIVGTVDLASPITGLNGKSLLINAGSGDERVTFAASGSLTGAEIVSQINTQLSKTVASLYTDGVEQLLMLRGDHTITLEINTAAPAGDATPDLFDGPNTRDYYMPWLSAVVFANGTQGTDNDSHVQGLWEITAINASTAAIRNELTLGLNASGVSFSNSEDIASTLGHYIHVVRNGYQRISAVDMSENQDSLGMYYWDVECTSEGHGDAWNVEPELQGSVTGYVSDGWEMSVADDNLSYSMAEEPSIHISPRVLLSGDDDPASFTTVLEENVQVEYEQEDIVEFIHSYLRSPSERTVNNNPLARGLTPTMVRMAITYANGFTESVARQKIAELVSSIMPNRQLEVSDIVQILVDSGATWVSLPITLVGISHQTDRSITVERSEDFISNDRLSVLTPDDDGTTTDGNSHIGLTRT